MPGLPMQQEAIAFTQKISSTDGTSLYDHLTDVVMKVSFADSSSQAAATNQVIAYLPELCSVQILNEQPTDPVNLLQTSLMVKKTANSLGPNSAQGLSLQVSSVGYLWSTG